MTQNQTTESTTDPLGTWLEQDEKSGRRAARMAASAKYLRENVPAGSRDSSGNSIETLIAALDRASK